METYFQLTAEEHPVLSAGLNLSGPAATWWTNEGRYVPGILSSWDVFKKQLQQKFTFSADSQQAGQTLSNLKQKDNHSVDEYMLVMRQLVSRITHGEPPNSSTLADYFYKGLSDQLRVFLAPMITQEVLTDVDKLYKAAQQAELNFNLSKPYQSQNQQNKQNNTPSGGVQGKRKDKFSSSAGAESSGTAGQRRGPQ